MAATFIQTMVEVPIVVDPSVGSADPIITLKVTNMDLKLSLDWIAKLAEAEVVVKDGKIVIRKPGADEKPDADVAGKDDDQF